MTLPDVLREALRRVKSGKAAVTIARDTGKEHAYQVRLTPDRTIDCGYRVSGRRWIVDARPGTEWSGWAPWTGFLGFGVDSIIADDWTIVTVEEL